MIDVKCIHYDGGRGVFSVQEARDRALDERIRASARQHYGDQRQVNARGYFSLLNVIYTISEIIEFSSRLSQKGIYTDSIRIEISIHNASGFELMPGEDRSWWNHFLLQSDNVGKEWEFDTTDLISSSAEQSFKICLWFFERFGWLDPPIEYLRSDQQKFLEGHA